MKRFKIESTHTIHKDSYNSGEGDYVNEYNLDCEIIAPDFQCAIIKYFIDELNYKFDSDKANFDSDENIIHYDNLVDGDNIEVLDADNKYNLWMHDQVQLYNNHSSIKIFELIMVKF